MYGSYGSYSVMSTAWDDLDLTPTNTIEDSSCAFPSWPRRQTLSSPTTTTTTTTFSDLPTSYLSDDDLSLSPLSTTSTSPSPFSRSDNGAAVSFGSSAVSSPISCSPSTTRFLQCERERHIREEEMAILRVKKAAEQREMVKMLKEEKEKRKIAAAKKARAKKAAKLAAISE